MRPHSANAANSNDATRAVGTHQDEPIGAGRVRPQICAQSQARSLARSRPLSPTDFSPAMGLALWATNARRASGLNRATRPHRAIVDRGPSCGASVNKSLLPER